MKTSILLIATLIFSLALSAQDIDIYSKKKNSNYELPQLNPQTSFEEFQLLNRTLRMQDMAYAAIVPGYVHFKVKDKAVGYSILAVRSVGFGGLIYVLNDNSFSLVDLINNSPPNSTNSSEFTEQQNITYLSLGVIVGSYLFDWIHGKHRLEKKQEMIRYKYGIKLNMSFTTSPLHPNSSIPTLGLRYSF